jgi:hypothetical protein
VLESIEGKVRHGTKNKVKDRISAFGMVDCPPPYIFQPPRETHWKAGSVHQAEGEFSKEVENS